MRTRRERGEQRMRDQNAEIMHLVYTFCERARHVASMIRISLNRAHRFGQGTRIGVLKRHGVGEKRGLEKVRFWTVFFAFLPVFHERAL